jgi:uncharacterized OsmC-like protein
VLLVSEELDELFAMSDRLHVMAQGRLSPSLTMAEATIEKHMASDPRRISKIVLDLDLSGNDWDELTKKKVIAAGKACPVARTLEGNVSLELNIH